MKPFICAVFLLSILSAGCADSESSNDGGRMRAGGKSPVVVSDKEIVAAADFAVKELEKILQKDDKGATVKLEEITDAQQQVVAGMKYHLVLKIKAGEQEKKVKAAVWKKLDGSYQLSEWGWIE